LHNTQHRVKPVFAGLLIMLAACAGTKTYDVPQHTDTAIEIASTIKAALVGAPDVDAASVRITLANEKIVVSGFVSSESERAEVARLSQLHARDYPVVNKVTVKTPIFD